jgi:hypothetical protein
MSAIEPLTPMDVNYREQKAREPEYFCYNAVKSADEKGRQPIGRDSRGCKWTHRAVHIH